MLIKSDPKVKEVFDNYPAKVSKSMHRLRELVLETANEIDGLDQLEETLKWGEPSYIAKRGSTLRMDWKPKNPNLVALYFQCSSKLVPTFKVIYEEVFNFEGKRAILLPLNEPFPEAELKHCIALTLTYHKVKHLPLLGA